MSLPEIILKLKQALKAKPYIHAMWLEGSYATGQFKDVSDIDVWLDVDKDKFELACIDFSSALSELGLERSHEQINYYLAEPYLAKAKFYVRDKTDDQRIELDMQAHGRNFVFSHKENDIVVLFDKADVITWKG